MSLHRRLEHLEQSLSVAGCPGCAIQQISLHHEYKLPSGKTITLPPIPKRPPCTCARPKKKGKSQEIVAIVVVIPAPFASREEAVRHYAEHAVHHRPWQADGNRESH